VIQKNDNKKYGFYKNIIKILMVLCFLVILGCASLINESEAAEVKIPKIKVTTGCSRELASVNKVEKLLYKYYQKGATYSYVSDNTKVVPNIDDEWSFYTDMMFVGEKAGKATLSIYRHYNGKKTYCCKVQVVVKDPFVPKKMRNITLHEGLPYDDTIPVNSVLLDFMDAGDFVKTYETYYDTRSEDEYSLISESEEILKLKESGRTWDGYMGYDVILKKPGTAKIRVEWKGKVIGYVNCTFLAPEVKEDKQNLTLYPGQTFNIDDCITFDVSYRCKLSVSPEVPGYDDDYTRTDVVDTVSEDRGNGSGWYGKVRAEKEGIAYLHLYSRNSKIVEDGTYMGMIIPFLYRNY